jgi:homoserine kinase
VKLTVRVPATAANLGPGFDCLALALDLANEFTVDTEGEPGVEVQGEGAEELPSDGTHLVFRTIAYLAGELGGALPAFRLSCRNAIPVQRGLGSSASAVVGGLLLADRLLDAGTSARRLLEVAVDLEGHPDNVAACMFGGLVAAYLSGEGWRVEAITPDPALRPALLVPEAERVSTEAARRSLPRTVPFTDAVFNSSRSALALLALTKKPELLAEALQDRLHQARRLDLAPGARALFQDLRDAGFPVCVAGSGPSLLVFEQDGRSVPELGPGWRVLRPPIDRRGAMFVGALTAPHRARTLNIRPDRDDAH